MALPSFPKPEPMPGYLQEDYHWADTHFSELAQQYPEEWAIVQRGEAPREL